MLKSAQMGLKVLDSKKYIIAPKLISGEIMIMEIGTETAPSRTVSLCREWFVQLNMCFTLPKGYLDQALQE